MLSEKLNMWTISLSKIECLLSQMMAAGGWATHDEQGVKRLKQTSVTRPTS